MSVPASKDPAVPAAPDSSRVPHFAYSAVLVGQAALVAGANSGIGKAVALSLARAGAVSSSTMSPTRRRPFGSPPMPQTTSPAQRYLSTVA